MNALDVGHNAACGTGERRRHLQQLSQTVRGPWDHLPDYIQVPLGRFSDRTAQLQQ